MSDDTVDISSMTEAEHRRYVKKQRKAAKQAAETEAVAAAEAEVADAGAEAAADPDSEAAEVEQCRQQKAAKKATKAAAAAEAEAAVERKAARKAARAAAAALEDEQEEEPVNTGKKRKREDAAAPTESKKRKTSDQLQLQSIESQLDEVDKAIKSVEEEIKQNTAAIGSATDATMRAFLMGKDPQLRDEKKMLREKEKLLLEKEKDLREEKKQPLGRTQLSEAEMVELRSPFLITDSIAFTREVLTDDEGNEHVMMVAPSIEGSSVVGPVFVSEAALRTMQEYVDFKKTNNSLVFMGPPKSSKSMMLHEVLPRLVVASKPELSPVFVRIVLDMKSSPTQAWQRIRAQLRRVCKAFGIGADVPSDTDLFDLLPNFALDVASDLKTQNLCLWLLIDECQAPLVNACSLAEKDEVAGMYKALVRELSDIGCCAFTGSSMVTFLNSVRDLKPNGFEMFNTAEYVLLGHRAPSLQWEQQIASSLIESMRSKSKKLLKIFGPDLTPELVLAALHSKPELFTIRPALIFHMLENLKVPKSTDEIESARLNESLRLVDDKLKAESEHDFLFALQALRDQHRFLESMRKLSDGAVANGVEAVKLFVANPAGHKLSKFAAMLCGLPDWKGAICPRLQPPYAEYCRDFITEEGGIFVVNISRTEAAGVKVELIDRFRSSLTLFGDRFNLFYKNEAQSISDSVVQVLFRAGIGFRSADGNPLRLVRSMFDHPLLQSLYEQSSIGYEDAFQRKLEDYLLWRSNCCCGRPPNSWLPGFQILKALRNFMSHDSDFTELLQSMSWRPVVLDSIVCAFEKCALQTPWGFCYSADKKLFKLPEHVLQVARALTSSGSSHNAQSRPPAPRDSGFVQQRRAQTNQNGRR